MNFGSTNTSTNGVNPSYFNVPNACCFSKEIINFNFEYKNMELDYLTSFYSDLKPKDDSHETKVAHFDQVRKDFSSKQQSLLQICKQRLA